MRLFGCEPTWRLLRPRILLPVLEDVGEADGDVDGRQRGQGTALRKERKGEEASRWKKLTILDLKMSSRPDRWLYWLGTLRRWTISKSVRTPGPWHSPAYTRLHFCWICTNMGTWLRTQEEQAAAISRRN
ncbi:hypothetical protein EYF80_039187 [Liparis tanakae]|uniref:Uncharacterized protein n=1 Tax=Liparis tanakae TaxID=230148 RepID=A0A4Z2GCF7_9TELE|nr:hypothetical protein EYF80_039187 [Liparis tanakae]